MPIYEYQREDGTVFEVLQKITDEPLSVCPTTGQKVERLISESAFHLKGSGWYKTDYSSNGSSASSKPSASTSSDSSTNSATSTDSGSTSPESSAGSSDSGSSSSGGGESSKKACGTGCGCH